MPSRHTVEYFNLAVALKLITGDEKMGGSKYSAMLDKTQLETVKDLRHWRRSTFQEESNTTKERLG